MRRPSRRFFLLVPILVVLVSFGGSAIADEGEPENATPGDTRETAPAEEKKATSSLIPYIPPSRVRPAPGIRTTGGTRGNAPGLPDVTLLVPDHVGLTLDAQPTLYWELSSESPVRIEITVIDLGEGESVEPLLEVPAKGPLGPGIHGFRIADHGLELEVGETYQWSVAVVPDSDRRAWDKIARGYVERIAPTEQLRAELADAGEPSRPRALARNGIWYDALTALSEQLAANPSDRRLRKERATLLEEVDLAELVARERAAGASH